MNGLLIRGLVQVHKVDKISVLNNRIILPVVVSLFLNTAVHP